MFVNRSKICDKVCRSPDSRTTELGVQSTACSALATFAVTVVFLPLPWTRPAPWPGIRLCEKHSQNPKHEPQKNLHRNPPAGVRFTKPAAACHPLTAYTSQRPHPARSNREHDDDAPERSERAQLLSLPAATGRAREQNTHVRRTVPGIFARCRATLWTSGCSTAIRRVTK